MNQDALISIRSEPATGAGGADGPAQGVQVGRSRAQAHVPGRVQGRGWVHWGDREEKRRRVSAALHSILYRFSVVIG